MRHLLWLIALPGCLIGADPRADGLDVGDPCEDDFDCKKGLVCHYEYTPDSDIDDFCREECDDDDDCASDEECDFDACVEAYDFEGYY